MGFKMKYTIETKYLPKGTKRRSGILMPRVGFICAHDTGNDGSTAYGNINYYINSANEISASAHTFVDDQHIVECIPATTGKPEKAWHVIYNVSKDNELFGDDANDIAIGVELCYSYKKGKINNAEAYKRYVWYLAYLCYKFGLDPAKKITGHFILDPARKSDPQSALTKMGKNFSILIQDVVREYRECTGVSKPASTGGAVTYKVKSGDTLFGIAKAYGTTVSAIKSLNGLSSDMIYVGQVLKLNHASAPKPIVAEDDEPMKLERWQVDMLAKALSELKGKGYFTSEDWITKAKNGSLTASELAFLNSIILSKMAVK